MHSVFDKIVKFVTLKTRKTIIVYAQWDKWASYDVLKLNMKTTDVVSKKL